MIRVLFDLRIKFGILVSQCLDHILVDLLATVVRLQVFHQLLRIVTILVCVVELWLCE